VLNAINPDELPIVVNPVENSVVAYPQLAQASEVFGHSHQSSVHNDVGIFSQPSNLPFNAGPDCWVQGLQLNYRSSTYFDLVGHEICRGFQALNSPRKSSRRASRSSRRTFGFLAVSQSSSSSRVSIDSKTRIGISTLSDLPLIFPNASNRIPNRKLQLEESAFTLVGYTVVIAILASSHSRELLRNPAR
jgi:hypothetical protein